MITRDRAGGHVRTALSAGRARLYGGRYVHEIADPPSRARPLSADDPPSSDSPVSAIDPMVSGLIFLMMLGLMAGGFVAFRMFRQPPPPAPPEVAGDPLLAQGRTIFLGRCATCHGNEGRGDGPIAGN